MHDGNPCGKPLYDDKKCICHSEKSDKNVGLFQKELQRLFTDSDTEDYDLTEFVFPEDGFQLPREFDRIVNFSGAKFLGEADFFERSFRSLAFFVDTKFLGEANFFDAVFDETVEFRAANFSKDATFFESVFSSSVVFRLARFGGNADFEKATFSGETEFSLTSFRRVANFARCHCTDTAVVLFDAEDMKGKRKIVFYEEGNFTEMHLDRLSQFTFRKLSLESCRFLETDLNRLQFVDVTWPKRERPLREFLTKFKPLRWTVQRTNWLIRNAIYDEVQADLGWVRWQETSDRKDEYEPPRFQCTLISQLYRQLQANYVNNYRYSEAGDFYIGEQEMMRKAKGKVGQYLSTNFLYKIISYYGESFMLPLFWLAFVLLLFPIFLFYNGINLDATFQGLAVTEMVNYEWSWSPRDFLLTDGEFLPIYWESFCANLSFVSFSRSEISKYLPESHTRLIVTIESLIVIALLAFFLLALRRKYKRKAF